MNDIAEYVYVEMKQKSATRDEKEKKNNSKKTKLSCLISLFICIQFIIALELTKWAITICYRVYPRITVVSNLVVYTEHFSSIRTLIRLIPTDTHPMSTGSDPKKNEK